VSPKQGHQYLTSYISWSNVKCQQWRSTIAPIPTEGTITSYPKEHSIKGRKYDVGNLGPSLGCAHTYGGVV
jgi:hypothetical protein